MPATAGAALRGANIARERLLRPYPQFDAVNTTTNEGESWYHALQVRTRTALRQRLHPRRQLHLLALHGGDRVPERRPIRSRGRASRARTSPHRLSVSGIWELPFGRGRRFAADAHACARRADRRLAGSGDLLVPERHPARRGATSSSRATSTTSRCRPASGRSLRWFNTDAGFNKVTGAAARVERPHVPAAAGQRSRQRHSQQRRPVGHQEHGDRPARRCSSGSRR